MSERPAAFTRISFGLVRGPNAVKAAAYNLSGQLDGFDFSRKARDYLAGAVLIPAGSPERFYDRETLWRELQAAERQQSTGQPARQVLLSIPRECPQNLWLDLARAVAADWVSDGMAAQLDVHSPRATDGEPQPHIHFMLSMRRLGPHGAAKTKERAWNSRFREDRGRSERARIAEKANTFFASHGLAIRIDPRSLEDQGIDREAEPTAPAQDWQRWLREGAQPEAQPITVKRVFEHRAAWAGWQQATAVATAAEAEAAALEIQIAELRQENARRIEAAMHGEAPRNFQQVIFAPARMKVARATDGKEVTDMAKKPAATTKPRPSEQWMRGRGGFDALSSAQQAQAKAAYEKWATGRAQGGKIGGDFGLSEYVDYVQDARARDEEARGDEAADMPSASPGPADQQPNRIAPTSAAAADESRKTHLQAVLADRYQSPKTLERWVRRIDVDPDGRRAVLHGAGGRIIDTGNEIQFDGAALSPELAAATVAAAHGHGWSALRVTGGSSYRDAIARAAALHEPPIHTDQTLSRESAAEVQEQLRQRATRAVPSLPDLAGLPPEQAAARRIDRERALAAAIIAGEPTGLRDPRLIASPQVAELVSRRNRAREDAVEAAEAADAHRAAHPWSARLLDSAVRRRQAALDAEAGRQDADARRLDRGHERSVRRIEKAAGKEAAAASRQYDDWLWSPAVRKAQAKLRLLDALTAAAATCNPAVAASVAAGDWSAAAEALNASQAAEAAARLASLTPAQQRDAALRRLAEHEQAAGRDAKTLAEARAVTAAAIAGDPDVLAAAAGGDLLAAAQAAEAFRRRQAAEEAERRRERDRILEAQMRRAAMDSGLTGPG